MTDARSLYINQIINHYRAPELEVQTGYYVTYRYSNAKSNSYRMLSHNEGLDVLRDYIKDLEKKVEELQYVERIIKLTKEN